MPVTAVAGGSGPVGRTIVEALVIHGGHTVHVLSRTVSSAFQINSYRVQLS